MNGNQIYALICFLAAIIVGLESLHVRRRVSRWMARRLKPLLPHRPLIYRAAWYPASFVLLVSTPTPAAALVMDGLKHLDLL